MELKEYEHNRVRHTNQKPDNPKGKYILYWMQAYRRLASNHALDFAIYLSKKYQKPLVLYEAVRKDYPWNSERIHRFILEGMCENREEAERLGLPYWCFVETDTNPQKGILKKISEDAVAIVTDDFPCFIIPDQISKLSNKISCALYAIDGNGIIPLKLYGSFASAARILRPRIHKLFPEAYMHRAVESYNKNLLKSIPTLKELYQPPFPNFPANKESIDIFLKQITFQNSVLPYPPTRGGRKEALRLLGEFLDYKIIHYAKDRSNPYPPEKSPASLLSPYLHFGHISQEEIVTAVLNKSINNGKWDPNYIHYENLGKRENYYSSWEPANSYLDELITWRDVGFQWFWQKPSFRKDLNDLPNWAIESFQKHKKDKREYLYSREELDNFKTHDPLWNAAQAELKITGRMHNYMRMLWGKKIIEWSPSIEEAYTIMEDFNNLYAYDGRNPNSYTGILWCFGMFDRPWFPERKVFGNVRYMSSDSTRKKFKVQSYLDYVNKLMNHQEMLF